MGQLVHGQHELQGHLLHGQHEHWVKLLHGTVVQGRVKVVSFTTGNASPNTGKTVHLVALRTVTEELQLTDIWYRLTVLRSRGQVGKRHGQIF